MQVRETRSEDAAVVAKLSAELGEVLRGVRLVVADPEASARFNVRHVLPGATCEWLGESLHVRQGSSDLAFQRGSPVSP